MLLSRRMEALKLKPISFTATDYGLAISTFKSVDPKLIEQLFAHFIIKQEVEKWLHDTALLKRTFRQIAIVTGLTERQIGGKRKNMKQVTFSTDLIFDVLRKYEPEHILLYITQSAVQNTLLDLDRLTAMLKRFHNRIKFKQLTRPSPFSIPIFSTFIT